MICCIMLLIVADLLTIGSHLQQDQQGVDLSLLVACSAIMLMLQGLPLPANKGVEEPNGDDIPS